MKKRSKLIMVISVVLVVALLSTLFVGCKKKDDPAPPPPPALKATEVLDAAVEAYQNAGFLETALSDMRLDFNLGVEGSVNGGTTKKYNLAVKMGLDLVNSWKTGYGNNYIDIICKDGDTQTLRFQYVNSKLADNQLGAWAEGKAKVSEDYAYLFAGDKAFKIKVPNVAVSLRYEMMNGGIGINPTQAEIDNKTYKHWISDQDIQDFLNDQLPGYLNMAVGLIGKEPALDTDAGTGSFSVPLSALLAPEGELGGVLAEFGPTVTKYLDMVGLKDNTIDSLVANVLPYIDLNVAFTGLNGETAPTTTITAKVGDDTKHNDITIAMKDDPSKGIFFKAPKCEGKLVMDVNVGTTAQYYTALTDAEKATAAKNTINGLNVKLAGTFDMLTEGGFNKTVGPLSINVPKAAYDWKIELDANPVALLGGQVDFTDPDKILDSVLGLLDYKDKTYKLINYLNVSITDKVTNKDILALKIVDNGGLKVTLNASALGFVKEDGSALLENQGIDRLIDLVKTQINKSNKKWNTPNLKFDAETRKVTWNPVTKAATDVKATEIADYEVKVWQRPSAGAKPTSTVVTADKITKNADGSFTYVLPADANVSVQVKANTAKDAEASKEAWYSTIKATDEEIKADEAKKEEQLKNTMKDVKKALLGLVLNVDLNTEGSEYAEGKYAGTTFAVKMNDNTYDESKLALTIAAKSVRIDKAGFKATEFHIFNSGSSLKGHDEDKIDITFNLAITTLEYGSVKAAK